MTTHKDDNNNNTRGFRTTKSVRFADEKNSVFDYERDIIHDDDVWLTRNDIGDIMEGVSDLARHWRIQGYSVFVDNTFEHPTESAEERIRTFVQHKCQCSGDTLRGIERYVSHKHDAERLSLEKRVVRAIVCSQRAMRERGWAATDRVEELRKISKYISRSAAAFARRLGKEDEAGALKDESRNPEAATSSSHNGTNNYDYRFPNKRSRYPTAAAGKNYAHKKKNLKVFPLLGQGLQSLKREYVPQQQQRTGSKGDEIIFHGDKNIGLTLSRTGSWTRSIKT